MDNFCTFTTCPPAVAHGQCGTGTKRSLSTLEREIKARQYKYTPKN